MTQLREAASSEVTKRFDEPCPNPKCSCQHIRTHRVPNYDLKLKIADWLYLRGVGRPAQAEGEQGEKIVFERVVYLGDETP